MELTAAGPSLPARATTVAKTARKKASYFRTDIEGLRAVAVTAVVAYHAGVPWLSGGFVGVDIFFVISGFLITGLLLRETLTTGRIDFVKFYARRARRILPSAAVVIAVVALVSAVVYTPLGAITVAHDLVASAVYYANWHFIALGTNYLAQSTSDSPVLHFWSLAVEEQFYLVWPVLIFAVVWVARKVPLIQTKMIMGLISIVTIASFVLCIVQTNSNANFSYMATTDRAWEFGAGAIAAAALHVFQSMSRARGGRVLGWVVGWAGIAAIVWTCFAFNAQTVFPGAAAAIPALGTVGIIVGGSLAPTSRTSFSAFLKLPPIRYIGKISFAWYLWHWPVLILAQAKFGPLPLNTKLLLMVAAFGIAVVSFHVVETPLAKWKLLATQTGAAFGVGILAMVVALGGSMGVGQTQINAANAVLAKEAHVSKEALVRDLTVASNTNAGSVTPSVVTAAKDQPPSPSRCFILITATKSPMNCNISPTGASSSVAKAGRVVLLGDSHGAQWYPVARSLADAENTDVEILTKPGCPIASISVYNPQLNKPYTQCDAWRANTLKRLAAEPKPSIIVMSELNRYAVPSLMAPALEKTMKVLEGTGAAIVYMQDTPFPNTDVPTCVSGHLADWSACALSGTNAFRQDVLAQQIQAGDYKHAHVVDLNSYLCPGSQVTCPVVRNGLLLYRDDSHLTNTAVEALTGIAVKKIKAEGAPE